MKTGTYLLSILSFSILFSCASVDKLIDSGNFDTALNKATRNIIGKKRMQEKHVRAVEEAFFKVMEKDMDLIHRKQGSNKSLDYAEILKVYDRINWRQDRIKALLPLEANSGYQPNFTFVDTYAREDQARQSYLEFTYIEALAWLEQGRKGDQKSAQLAFDKFEKLWEHTSTFKDAQLLQAEAYDLGLVEIGIGVKNLTGRTLSKDIINSLLGNGCRDTKWIHFYRVNTVPATLDIHVTIELANFDVSAEQWYERQTIDRKDIEDGFEYLLDQNGNVTKDSLGNDVKIALWNMLEAYVTEIHQRKQAILSTVLLWQDREYNVLDSKPLQTESVFEHFSSAFEGDKRALSKHARKHLHKTPLPYPTGEDLFEEAVLNLAPILKQKLNHLHHWKDLAMHKGLGASSFD